MSLLLLDIADTVFLFKSWYVYRYCGSDLALNRNSKESYLDVHPHVTLKFHAYFHSVLLLSLWLPCGMCRRSHVVRFECSLARSSWGSSENSSLSFRAYAPIITC